MTSDNDVIGICRSVPAAAMTGIVVAGVDGGSLDREHAQADWKQAHLKEMTPDAPDSEGRW